MEIPKWTSINDPRSEAFHNIEGMKQHMVRYSEWLSEQQSVTPEEISILWTAYKSAGNTLEMPSNSYMSDKISSAVFADYDPISDHYPLL
ncbi:hypothetical protein PIROE2DRAFT_9045, partial [Piromyces sp. E2]